MAWTAPRTWVSGEIVSAALMNTHVRDNFLETGPAIAANVGDLLYADGANSLARLALGGSSTFLKSTGSALEWSHERWIPRYKSADETVNNSSTVQNDDDISFPIAANEVWAFHMVLAFSSASATPDGKFAITGPTGATGHYQVAARSYVLVGNSSIISGYTDTLGEEISFDSVGTRLLILIDGVMIASSTAGTIQLQWAQRAATVEDTKILAGSYGLFYDLTDA